MLNHVQNKIVRWLFALTHNKLTLGMIIGFEDSADWRDWDTIREWTEELADIL